MSRSPTDFRNFWSPLVPIQPEARPTDQFVTPAVKPGNSAAYASLANSLSRFEPVLKQVADSQSQAYQSAEEMRAAADKGKWKSINDFNQAVKNGQISETQNPWYVRRTRELLAIDTANQARTNAEAAWDQNAAVKGSDDPNVAHQFFSQQLQGVTNGMDVYSASAANTVLSQSMNYLMQKQEAHREEMRPIEHQDAYSRTASSILQPIDAGVMQRYAAGDPDATHQVNIAKAALQNLQQSELKFTDPVTVRNWTKDVLTNASLDRLSGDVFRQFYLGLTKSDGSPLDPSDAAKSHARDLDRTVVERQLQQRQIAHQNDELTDEQDKRTFRGQLEGWVEGLRKTNPKANYTDVDLSQHWQEIPTHIRMDAAQLLSQGAMAEANMTESGDSLKRRDMIMAQGSAALKDPKKLNFLLNQLVSLNGLPQAHQMEMLYNATQREGALVSDPHTLTQLYDQWNAGDTEGLGDKINDSFLNEKITKGDWEQLRSRVTSSPGGPMGIRGQAVMQDMSHRLEQQVLSGYFEKMKANGTLPEGRDGQETMQLLQGSPTVALSVQNAKGKFNEVVDDLMTDPKFRAMNAEQKRKELQPYLDSIAVNNKGHSTDEYDAFVTKLGEQATQPKKAAPLQQALPVEQALNRPINRIASAGDPVLTPEVAGTAERAASILKDKLPEDQWAARPKDPTDHPLDQMGGVVTGLGSRFTPDALTTDPAWKLAWAYGVTNPLNKRPSSWNPDSDWLQSYRYFSGDGSLRAVGLRKNFHQDPEVTTQAVAQQIPDLTRQARLEAQALEARVTQQKVPEQYSQLVNHILENGGDAKPAEVAQLNSYNSMLSRLAVLRRYGGYGKDEWKKLGPDGWKNVPLFSSSEELHTNIDAAMKEFGMNPTSLDDYKNFRQQQEMLIAKMRNVRPN